MLLINNITFNLPYSIYIYRLLKHYYHIVIKINCDFALVLNQGRNHLFKRFIITRPTVFPNNL